MKKPDKFLKQSKEKLKPTYNSVNSYLHGGLDIIQIAGKNFAKERAPEAAASMAYFTLFSFFPLVIVVISLSSVILKSQFVQDQILVFLTELIPVSPDLILNNMQSILEKRGTFGVIALLSLTWSATSMFNIFALNLDRAWPDDKSHNFFERRFIGFAILFGVLLLLLIFWFFRALLEINLVEHILILLQVPIFETTLWGIITFIGPKVFRFVMFWIVYQWIPKATVRSHEAFWGAVVTTLLTELLTLIMRSYLSIQLVRYELIYGSLGSIVAMLLWVYFVSYIIFFGAHISSAISINRKNKLKQAQEKLLIQETINQVDAED